MHVGTSPVGALMIINERFEFRLTEQDRRALAKVAKDEGMKPSQWLRAAIHRAKRDDIPVKVISHAVENIT